MNDAERKPAEQLLRDAERAPGFCTTLIGIATSGGVEASIAKLAMHAAKNALGRTWSQARDPRAPSIGEEEKATLRAAVVAAVCSSAVQGDMALQLALIAAKIARFDFPRRWPELLPALAEGLQSSEEIVVFHSVRCLHYVLKERTTKQLIRDRLDFIDSVTPQILGPLAQMWSARSAAAMTAATPQAIAGMPFVLSQLLDKCMLTLLCHGFRPGKINPEDSPMAAEILPALVEKTESLYAALSAGCRAAAPSFHSLLKGLGRLQEAQPKALLLTPPGRPCALLSSVLQLALQVLTHGRQPGDGEEAPQGRPPFKSSTPATALRVVHLPTARLIKVSAGRAVLPPEEREACTAAIRGVLSQENCSQLVWVLITQFLPLDDGYLQDWAAEPERAIAEESASELLEQGHGHAGANSDAEEMDARTAAMALLLALSSAFPEVVVPILGDGLQNVVTTPMAPLETEAWVTVAGIGVPAMASAGFDVGGWVAAMLVSPAVAAPDGYAPEPYEAGIAASTIVGRRASWCIGQLAKQEQSEFLCLLPTGGPAPLCGAVVDALLHWMEPGGDLAVQCTAAASLRKIVGEDGVVAALTENGGMRANLAVERLLSLMVTAEGPTRKWQAVNVVMKLVKIGAIAGTVAESSMAQIVAAWNSSCQDGSEGHAELLQAALLDLLTQLAGLSPEVSASVEGASCHMIRYAVPIRFVAFRRDAWP